MPLTEGFAEGLSPSGAWIQLVSADGYVDSWEASMRIRNTGVVKYPAYRRSLRIPTLYLHMYVYAAVRSLRPRNMYVYAYVCSMRLSL